MLKKIHGNDLPYSYNFFNFKVQSIELNWKDTFDMSDLGFVSTKSPPNANSSKFIKLTPEDQIYSYLNYANLTFAAFYNEHVIRNLLSTRDSVRLTYVGYLTPKLFTSKAMSGTKEESSLTSHIFSDKQQISTYVVKVSPIRDFLPESNLVYTLFEQEAYEKQCAASKNTKFKFKCVFWDYARSDWRSFGCKHSLRSFTSRNQIYHVCNCNHTTNFALLMVVDDEAFCAWCDTALFWVSIVGIVISVIGLLGTIFYDIVV